MAPRPVLSRTHEKQTEGEQEGEEERGGGEEDGREDEEEEENEDDEGPNPLTRFGSFSSIAASSRIRRGRNETNSSDLSVEQDVELPYDLEEIARGQKLSIPSRRFLLQAFEETVSYAEYQSELVVNPEYVEYDDDGRPQKKPKPLIRRRHEVMDLALNLHRHERSELLFDRMEGIMQQAVHIDQTTIDTIRKMCCLVFWTPGLPFAANNTYLFRTLQAFFNKHPHLLGPAKKCLQEVGSTTFEEFRKVAHSAFDDLRSQTKVILANSVKQLWSLAKLVDTLTTRRSNAFAVTPTYQLYAHFAHWRRAAGSEELPIGGKGDWTDDWFAEVDKNVRNLMELKKTKPDKVREFYEETICEDLERYGNDEDETTLEHIDQLPSVEDIACEESKEMCMLVMQTNSSISNCRKTKQNQRQKKRRRNAPIT